ncbi:Lupus brain antigen 1-like protein [Perkinsela sp. CCAP 1560/4]|nr:Lupus brain antigen 1-like protein [Perkinsela sp. CCAP 1560/4]|eukprot:KNH08656.1 Lupus brain antigen 1-like protein [Perkinsela sp. CCAP 1560/4]
MKFWICTKCTYKNSTRSICSMCRTKKDPNAKEKKSNVVKASSRQATSDSVPKNSPTKVTPRGIPVKIVPRKRMAAECSVKSSPKKLRPSRTPSRKSGKSPKPSRSSKRKTPKDKDPSPSDEIARSSSFELKSEVHGPAINLEDILRQEESESLVETTVQEEASATIHEESGIKHEHAEKMFQPDALSQVQQSPSSRNGQSEPGHTSTNNGSKESHETDDENETEKTAQSGIIEVAEEQEPPCSLSSFQDAPLTEVDYITGADRAPQASSSQTVPLLEDTQQAFQSAGYELPSSAQLLQSPVRTDEPQIRTLDGAIVDIPEHAIIAAASKYDLPLPERYKSADYLTQRAIERSATKVTYPSDLTSISYTELQFKDPTSPLPKLPHGESPIKTLREVPAEQKKLFASPGDEIAASDENMKPSEFHDEVYTPHSTRLCDASPGNFSSIYFVDDNDLDAQGTDAECHSIVDNTLTITRGADDSIDTEEQSVPPSRRPDESGEPYIRTATGNIIDIADEAVIAAATKYELPLPAKYSSQEYLDKRVTERKLSQEKPSEDGTSRIIQASAYVYQPPKKVYQSTPAPRLGQTRATETQRPSGNSENSMAARGSDLPELTTYELPEHLPLQHTISSQPESFAGADSNPDQPAAVKATSGDTQLVPEIAADLQFRTASGRVIPLSTEAIQRAALKYDLPIPATLKNAGSPSGHDPAKKACFNAPQGTHPESTSGYDCARLSSKNEGLSH